MRSQSPVSTSRSPQKTSCDTMHPEVFTATPWFTFYSGKEKGKKDSQLLAGTIFTNLLRRLRGERRSWSGSAGSTAPPSSRRHDEEEFQRETLSHPPPPLEGQPMATLFTELLDPVLRCGPRGSAACAAVPEGGWVETCITPAVLNLPCDFSAEFSKGS
ncbi:hypothetical protein EYF80_023448 [Liparis tanakae]|uniref:Uncharacterized protein n=1 Tax=Liparis tanakae TaxID=230148 RepID=A0A4Z2HNI5_9TELE|nr:hypothetical protein EYF80_023448 [Liparis tanakae]